MNSPEKMAYVRERFSLPEPGAAHECRATYRLGVAVQPHEAERAERLRKDSPCYKGQWTLHGPHDYECRVQNWLGGGTVMSHCPGKTEATVLG